MIWTRLLRLAALSLILLPSIVRCAPSQPSTSAPPAWTKTPAGPPPTPFEVPVDDSGVQAISLVVAPSGYQPASFSVRQGVPVRLTFRQLGEVGCGDTLIFPADPAEPTTLQLAAAGDERVLEFTPEQAGEYLFHCSHKMFVGTLTVRK